MSDDFERDEGEGAPDDEGVGYCRPPKKSRWQKGQSGNPKGRKKGSRGLKTDLHVELNATRSFELLGHSMKGTSQQLMLRTLAARAATGNVAAARLLIDLTLQIFGSGDRGEDRQRLSGQDQALLDRLLAGRSGDPPFSGDEPDPPTPV